MVFIFALLSFVKLLRKYYKIRVSKKKNSKARILREIRVDGGKKELRKTKHGAVASRSGPSPPRHMSL